MADQRDHGIVEVVTRERSRLWRFIRRRVPDPRDAEDILQEVFAELVEANRLLMPIDHVSGWLFRVARNRITDLFRKKRPEPLPEPTFDGDSWGLRLEDLLPSSEDGPDTVYARREILEALERAIEALPAAEREVFMAHEVEGRSFKVMAAESGVSVNTLLSRKHRAVRRLRERLQASDGQFSVRTRRST